MTYTVKIYDAAKHLKGLCRTKSNKEAYRYKCEAEAAQKGVRAVILIEGGRAV